MTLDLCPVAVVVFALSVIAGELIRRRVEGRVTADELHPDDVPTSAERAGLRYEEE